MDLTKYGGLTTASTKLIAKAQSTTDKIIYIALRLRLTHAFTKHTFSLFLHSIIVA